MKAVNLIPSDQRSGGGPVTGQSDGGAFLVLGLLAGLAVLAGLYGIAAHQVSSRKGQVAKINAEVQVAQARVSQLAPYVSFKTMYQTRLQTVSELVNTRFDWAHAFHELGRVLPNDASISSVHGTIAAATGSTGSAPAAAATSPATAATAASTVSSATPPGSVPTFLLAGCATSQSEVAQTLQRLRLIDGVGDVTLQSSTKAGGGGGAGGGCPAGDPAFAMTVNFTALPAPPSTGAPASAGSTATASSTGSAAAPTTPATPVASTGGAQ